MQAQVAYPSPETLGTSTVLLELDLDFSLGFGNIYLSFPVEHHLSRNSESKILEFEVFPVSACWVKILCFGFVFQFLKMWCKKKNQE